MNPFHSILSWPPPPTLTGQLLDAQNQPLAAQRIYLSGPELPPSCSVLAETRTDSGGHFRFVNVPTGRSWWFALPESRDLRSDSMTVTDSGEQQVRLRRIDRGSESVLELA